MKIERYPLVSLYEISGIIAHSYMFHGLNEQALTSQYDSLLSGYVEGNDRHVWAYYSLLYSR